MQTKFILFGVGTVVVLIFGIFIFSSGYEIKNYPKGLKNPGPFVLFGDSLVEGVGASEGNDLAAQLGKRLGITIEKFGRSGDTTDMALSRMDTVIARKPKMVLIVLGGNDYLKRRPKAQTFVNLEHIAEEFQKTGAIVAILGVRGGLLADNYEEDYEKSAEKVGAIYVPNILSKVLFEGSLMSDSIHPNDAGYAIVAEEIADRIKKYTK